MLSNIKSNFKSRKQRLNLPNLQYKYPPILMNRCMLGHDYKDMFKNMDQINTSSSLLTNSCMLGGNYKDLYKNINNSSSKLLMNGSPSLENNPIFFISCIIGSFCCGYLTRVYQTRN